MENEVINIAQNGNPKNKNVTKKAIIICAIAFSICLIACALVLASVFKPKSYIELKHLWTSTANEVYIDETLIKSVSAGFDLSFSIDGKGGMILDSGILYSVDGELKNCTQIATNVSIADVSASGNSICYVGSDGNLCLYMVKTKKTKTIDKNVNTEYLAISPKGSAIAYTKIEDDLELYVWNGKANLLDDDLIPIAVTDDAKTIYCKKLTNNSFYSYSYKGKGVKLSDNIGNDFILNYYGNEIIFIENGTAFASCDGCEKNELFPADSIMSIVNKGVKAECEFRYVASSLVVRSPYKTNAQKYYVASSSDQNVLCYIGNKFDGKAVCSGTYFPVITKNNKTAYFIDADYNLCKYDLIHDVKSIVSTDITSFDIDDNAKYIYAVNIDGKLFRANVKKQIVLAKNVSELVILGNKIIFQTDSDDEYYGILKSIKLGKTEITEINKEASMLGVYGDFVLSYDANGNIIFTR